MCVSLPDPVQSEDDAGEKDGVRDGDGDEDILMTKEAVWCVSVCACMCM